MPITRRTLLKLAGLAPAAKIVGVQIAHAEDRAFRHALTLFEDVKYPPDFKHFDYVNPAAPKGGRVRFGIVGSFDNLNPYTFKGEAGECGAERCAAGLRPRRAIDRIRPRGERRVAPGGPLHGGLSPAARGALP